MAPICPRLYFFMAHQCSTWCPSSIGEGRGFGFLPPRETTISIQQAPEVPEITADGVLSDTFCILLFFQSMTPNLSREWRPTLLDTTPTWGVKKTKQHTKKKTPLSTIVGNFVFSSFCSPFHFSCRLDLLCRLNSSGDPNSALTSLMSESMRKPAKPVGSFRS